MNTNMMALNKSLSDWDKGIAVGELAAWLRKYSISGGEMSPADSMAVAKEVIEGRPTLVEMAIKNMIANPNDETMKQLYQIALVHYK